MSERAAGMRAPAGVQGLFYLATGVWPLAHVESFAAVTGPKTDLWLVYTVGGLVAVVGLALLAGAWNRRVTPELALLGAGCAAALAAVDVVFVICEVIPPVYLADAAAEAVLALWWAVAYLGRGRTE
jgi:hypothetical protein